MYVCMSSRFSDGYSRVHKERNILKNTTLGQEPALIIYYTMTEYAIKWST